MGRKNRELAGFPDPDRARPVLQKIHRNRLPREVLCEGSATRIPLLLSRHFDRSPGPQGRGGVACPERSRRGEIWRALHRRQRLRRLAGLRRPPDFSTRCASVEMTGRGRSSLQRGRFRQRSGRRIPLPPPSFEKLGAGSPPRGGRSSLCPSEPACGLSAEESPREGKPRLPRRDTSPAARRSGLSEKTPARRSGRISGVGRRRYRR